MGKSLNAQVQLRNDTAANWATTNPVLLKGELGIAIDTARFKIGDGVSTWSELKYSGVLVSASTTNGNITIDGTDIAVYTLPIASASVVGGVKSQTPGTGKVVVAGDGTMSVGQVEKANQLATARTISVAGDATGSGSFNGTTDMTMTIALVNMAGLTAGSYTKLTVNSKGQVTAGTSLVATDIPNLTLAKISNAGTAAAKNVGTGAGNVPVLDSSGKLSDSVIPALAIGEVFEVASETAMLALTAQTGDVAVRSDINTTFILKTSPASTLANWVKLKTPTDLVQSINGKTGVVTLTTNDIAEGTNLYFSQARATANFNSNFALKSSTGLTDGATIVHTTDTLIIDCGNA